jgi:hypothetical protein
MEAWHKSLVSLVVRSHGAALIAAVHLSKWMHSEGLRW